MARSSDLPALVELLKTHHSLYDAAGALPVHGELRGRGVALVVDLAGHRCVVRHYHRGGALGDVLADRYLRFAANRVLHELHISEHARTRGVATPRVVCGAWYAQGLFHRYDIATEHIPDSQDLSAVLFGDVVASDLGLMRAAQLIRSMLQAGLVHRDLNVKNILIAPDRGYVLDLDRCTLTEGVDRAAAAAMRARFFRSVNKWEARTGQRVHDVARNKLSEAFDG